MELSIIQILLLSLLSALAILDALTYNVGFNRVVIVGMITGLICGDMVTGLFIGGTLHLLILGVSTYGGASIPDYATATIIATALSVISGLTPQEAIALAVPVGLLLINLDIAARWSNTFIVQLIEKDIKNEKYDSAMRKNYLGIITWGLSRFIPVFVALLLGQAYITSALDWINANISWLLTGLGVAGGLLPVVGIAILLRYLPAKKYFFLVLAGFLLVAYLNVPITGVALFGLIIAIVVYRGEVEKQENLSYAAIPSTEINEEEGYYEYEEL